MGLGKKDFFSPKAIGNRMKSKGLQKLRWFCQTCEKQCRDENGFKCHVMSEGHQRQMQLFAQNSQEIVSKYSEDFEARFMALLSRRFGTRRVLANDVYREYIADKTHLHMNATKWLSLTEFVMYLGREGKCVVDETERGWYLKWIDNSPDTLAKKEAVQKMERLQKDQDERERRMIQQQVERGKAAYGGGIDEEPEKAEFKRADDDERIAIALKPNDKGKSSSTTEHATKSIRTKAFADSDDEEESSFGGLPAPATGDKRKPAAIDEILNRDILAKKQKPVVVAPVPPMPAAAHPTAAPPMDDNDAPWLLTNIVVKNRNKELADGKYYNEKAVVRRIIDDFVGEIQLLSQPTIKIRIDQAQLETVIPAIGGHVAMVRGEHRGRFGVLEEVDVERYAATIVLEGGSGEWLTDVDYEWFSKLHIE